MARKTKAQLQADHYAARRAFLEDLGRVETYVDAMKLAHGTIHHPSARQCYSNLAYFLGFGDLPHGADEDECRAYVALWKRIPEAKEGSAERFEKGLAAKFSGR